MQGDSAVVDAAVRAALDRVEGALVAAREPRSDLDRRLDGIVGPVHDQPSSLPAVERAVEVYGLTSFERDVILLGLACEIDPRIGALVGELAGDPARTRPTVGLVLRVFEPWIAEARIAAFAALGPAGRMVRLGLIELRGDGPHVSCALRLAAAFWPRLVGLDAPPVVVVDRVSRADALVDSVGPRERIGAAARWLQGRVGRDALVVLVGPDGSGRGSLAGGLLAATGRPAITIDAATVATPTLLRELVREALWHRAGVIARGLAPVTLAELVRELPVPVVAIADERAAADLAAVAPRATFHVSVELPGPEARAELWRHAVGDRALGPDVDLDELAARFEVSGERIMTVVAAAASRAEGRLDPRLERDDLYAGCRRRAAPGVGVLVRRPAESRTLDDLVVPAATRADLELVLLWGRHGHRAFGMTGPGRRAGRVGAGAALFAGPPGTGKTMAAEVIADALGLELWRVDLAHVVSKYIGETEKNLDRVFADAAAGGAALFFDEADAVFGKRTEVRDAHDRYANLETAFLLQRLEQHRGLVMLATNLDKNLDPAFLRRIPIVASFPLPDAAGRFEIWRRHVEPNRLDVDVDLRWLASRFALSGGDIRNVVATAAVYATAADAAIGMSHLVIAVWRELRKAGRLVNLDDFGTWRSVVPAVGRG